MIETSLNLLCCALFCVGFYYKVGVRRDKTIRDTGIAALLTMVLWLTFWFVYQLRH